MIVIGAVLMWLGVLLAIVGVVAWRTGAWRDLRPGPDAPPDTLPTTQPADDRADLPPAWVNTLPGAHVPGPSATEDTRP